MSISKSKLSRELYKANSFLEHIELANEELFSTELFGLMDLAKL